MENNKLSKSFLDAVMEFHKVMRANEINLIYEGEITHNITKAFTSLTEKKMNEEDEATSTQKKVFHVMVECLQNISKHADNPENSYSKDGRGIFMVHKSDNVYKITTGNLIINEKVEDLREFLEKLNSMNKDELKSLYKKQIKEGRLSEKKGAGLGFIDIARKTDSKLLFDFLPVDDTTSFFILTSTIERKK
jgi:transcription termination factor NusB